MSHDLRERALELFNKAHSQQEHGSYKNSLKNYLISLDIQEKLARSDPFFNTWVATTLNNLGALLKNMGRPEDARKSYERALEMREALLAGEPSNVVYQSQVAMTLNNLGLFMDSIGKFPDAKKFYEKSIGILKEPQYYITIKAKSRAILNLIQLISKEADWETNILTKSGHFKDIYDLYLLHGSFFSKFDMEYENRLAKEMALTAHIHYLMLKARNEKETDTRIKEYEKCIQEVTKILQDETDDRLKELWSSIVYYLEGRVLINEAIKYDIPDKELIRLAVEKFKLAGDRYKNAQICYFIYSILLEIESAEKLDDNNIPKLKEKLKTAIKSLPERMEPSVKSVFKEIQAILDKKKPQYDPESFRKINRCITKIDYSALGEIFIHMSGKMETYFKEPFSPNVFYNNGILTFRFDDPEKIKGRLTIRAGNRILFDGLPGKRNEIDSREYRINPPEKKEEIIFFETFDGKKVSRSVNLCDKIMCGGNYFDFHTIIHDCKHGICGNNFNIAVVQLKYDLYQEDGALKIKCDEKYHQKVKMIMDEVINIADLVVFPEFSIPFKYLPELQKYSDDHGIFIIAGTHYVTDENLKEHNGLFADNFDDKDLLKNISPVIIPGSKIILHTEKVGGAKIERAFGSNIGMKNGKLNRIFKFNEDVRCGIIICYDLLDNTLRSRIIDACNIIIVPQTSDVTGRLREIARSEIDNPSGTGTKAFIMASGLFTFPGMEGINGGESGVITTLDKDTYKKNPDYFIIKPVKIEKKPVMEQFIQLVSLNMNFNAARDTQGSPVPITYKLIHIFEKNEIFGSKMDSPGAFLEIIGRIRLCNEKDKLKKILETNMALIQRFSPLWHREIWGNVENPKSLKNFDLDQMKYKCQTIVIE